MKLKADLECDFLVIGGGTIGLPMAVWLAEQTSKKVICVEAGAECDKDQDILGQPAIIGNPYKGASEGRKFCVGGTSTVWGGALLPFQAADCDVYGWPFNSNELQRYFPEIENLFSLPKNKWLDVESNFETNSYVKRRALWPSFKNRNTYTILEERISKLDNLTLLKNCPVTRIDKRSSPKLVQVENEKVSTVSATNIIICAGAIESTRLAKLCTDHGGVGLGFSDHLSVSVGKINSRSLNKLNKEFAFGFLPDGVMQNSRYEMANDSSARKNIPPHYFYISFVNSRNLGTFHFLRELMRDAQSRKRPKVRNLVGILFGIDWIANMIYWRLRHKALLRPKGSQAEMQIVIQQEGRAENSIDLDTDRQDSYGGQCPVIRWKISDKDKLNTTNAINNFHDFWSSSLSDQYGELQLYDINTTLEKTANCGGVYHPTSSLQFGDSEKFPLDQNMYLRGANNIQVVSTACLPTGGGANPTMMALLLAARCVEQHASA